MILYILLNMVISIDPHWVFLNDNSILVWVLFYIKTLYASWDGSDETA